jgi:hypothetical protein
MRKVLLLALVLVLTASMLSGCSMLKKAKEIKGAVDEFSGIVDELEEIEENEDEKVFGEQLYIFESGTDLLNAMKEFGYDWINEEGDVEWSVEWEVLGQEDVDGVNAVHVRCKKNEYGTPEEYELWFNDEWLAVKALYEGEEKLGWEAEGLGYWMAMMAQNYVNYAALTNIVFTNSDMPGILDGSAYKLESKKSENISLGGSPVKAEVFKVKSLWVNAYWEMGIAKVGGKHLYVILKQGVDDASGGLVVTRAAVH